MRKCASKSKQQKPKNMESVGESLSLSTENEDKMIAGNKAGEEVIGNQTPTTDSSVMNPDSLIEAGKLEQGNKEISTGGSSPVAVAEVPLENGSEATKSEKKKRNRSKGMDLPRRTSKRLAGIEVDLSLESTLHTRSRRAAGRQISEVEGSGPKKCDIIANSDEHGQKLSTGKQADLKPESIDVLPFGDSNFPAENPNIGANECKADEKEEVSVDLPFSELWNDPCIEFAIKTLTGIIPIGEENKTTMNEGASANTSDVVTYHCQDLPPMDIWADPCIEFAVKTLTGDFPPVVTNPTLEAMLKKPSNNSPQLVGQNGCTVPSIKSGGSSHDKDSFRHSNVACNPQAK